MAAVHSAFCRSVRVSAGTGQKSDGKDGTMNRKELAEIKRRLDPEKGNVSVIRGCYVSAKGEVISVFRRPVGPMGEEELKQFYTRRSRQNRYRRGVHRGPDDRRPGTPAADGAAQFRRV